MSSKIRVDNALIILQIGWQAIGKHLAIGKAIDVRGEIHDHPHIMLDHAQRDAQFFICPLQPVDLTIDQCWVNAGCRLVQKQNLRLIHQSHCEFQQLLLAKGQITRNQVTL